MLFAKIEESCALIQGMADRLGRDIPGAVEIDPETQAVAYRNAVLRCAACECHGACRQLQAENATLDAAPEYCRNSWT